MSGIVQLLYTKLVYVSRFLSHDERPVPTVVPDLSVNPRHRQVQKRRDAVGYHAGRIVVRMPQGCVTKIALEAAAGFAPSTIEGACSSQRISDREKQVKWSGDTRAAGSVFSVATNLARVRLATRAGRHRYLRWREVI